MTWQEMNAATRRKAVILAVIVGVGIAALLWPAGTITLRRRPSLFPVRKGPPPDPRGVAGGGRTGPVPGAQGAPQPARGGALLGKWETETAGATKRGICMLNLEITRKGGTPDQFNGATTLRCVPVPGLSPSARVVPPAIMLAEITPLSATMTGTWDKGVISFGIDRLFNAGDCGWTGLSVSRFGSANLTAEYHDACGGGAMVMRKAG